MALASQRLEVFQATDDFLREPSLQRLQDLRSRKTRIAQLLAHSPASDKEAAELSKRSVGIKLPGFPASVELTPADVETATALSAGLSLSQVECVELLCLTHQVRARWRTRFSISGLRIDDASHPAVAEPGFHSTAARPACSRHFLRGGQETEVLGFCFFTNSKLSLTLQIPHRAGLRSMRPFNGSSGSRLSASSREAPLNTISHLLSR